MANVLALEVLLNGEWIGTTSLCTVKMLQVSDGKVRSNTLSEEIKSAIATVCFMHPDDLLSKHSFEDFSVKGTFMRE